MNFQRKRIIISVGGTVILLSMIGLVLYPLGRGIEKDYQVLLATGKEVAKITRDIENVRKFENSANIYKAEFSSLQDLFISPDTPIPFIEFLEQASQSSQLELTIIPGNSKQVKGDFWPSMNFQLTLEGSYPNFVRFVEILEAAPYLIELKSLSMNKFRSIRGVETKSGGEFTVLVKAYTK